ncbi:hypothetical protein K432DRAFT_385486 [Lepidopterella palustris CBS 459.81]|uniref:F-box domain-containing protein n=1 Tax=Lepidopterella palustris CBS 459.81 TaxID=1314670 RepID=A0A8E2JBX3_9PEZI|nr:hypothetical protein K432DRAFT_385486 [Lepidopterella palustris CBS 459.81]
MALEDLPMELLLQIMHHVGAKSLRKPGVLTVSKRWYAAAQPVALENLHLTYKSLAKLPSRFSRQGDLLAINLKHLEIRIPRYEDDPDRALPFLNSKKQLFALDLEGGRGVNRAAFDSWAIHLNSSLEIDGPSLLQPCKKLRSFTIVAEPPKNKDRPGKMHIPYIFSNSLGSILDVLAQRPLLTTLVIDVGLSPAKQDLWSHFHICPDIAKLIPRLRHLRLRLPSICSQVLEVDQACNPIPLRELIVNIGRQELWPHCGGIQKSTLCKSPGFFTPTPILPLLGVAEELATRAPEVSMMRILLRKDEDGKVLGVNCLTSMFFVLADDAAWDSDEIFADETSDRVSSDSVNVSEE